MRRKLFTFASLLSLLLCLATLVLCLLSYRRNTSCSIGRFDDQFRFLDVAFFSGRVYIAGGKVNTPLAKLFELQPGVSFNAIKDKEANWTDESGHLCWWHFDHTVEGSRSVSFRAIFPLPVLTGLTAVLPALVAFRIARRRRQLFSTCVECGYNLTGNTSGVCPECGTPIAAKAGKVGA